ncbi:MAG: PIN domain-containing protein [Burkholderiaceae bacterium]
MIGLDTNVLVRYIMQDDAHQSALAGALIESLSPQAPGYVPLAVVVELGWVLASAYSLERAQVAQALEILLRTKELVTENAEVVWQAVRLYRSTSADYADCLIHCAATAAHCTQTMSFDRAAVKHCGMTLVGASPAG